jgi:SurA-like protein
VAPPLARALVPSVLVLVATGCSRPAGTPSTSPSAADLDPARPLPSPIPDVVARVNGEPIRIQQILPMAKAEFDRVSLPERDRKKPEVVRHALQEYIDRELLLQEALARGIQADSADVDWNYDQLRREHPDEGAWRGFLAQQGMDPQSFRAELRAQHTVAALLEQEVQRAPKGEAEPAVPPDKVAEVRQALLARLRAKARIELFL